MERTMTFEEFVEKLRSVRDNYNFILGVVSNAITPEERRKIAYYIDHGKTCA